MKGPDNGSSRLGVGFGESEASVWPLPFVVYMTVINFSFICDFYKLWFGVL
jgi:hypothetical protein